MIDWGVAIKVLASLLGCMLFAFGQSYNQNPDGKTMVHIAAVSISVGSYLLGLFQAKPTGNGGGGAPGPIARSLMLLLVLPAQLVMLLRAVVVVVLVAFLTTGCLGAMSAEQLRELAKDKNAIATCAEVRAPYPGSVSYVNSDRGVVGKLTMKCGQTEITIEGPAK